MKKAIDTCKQLVFTGERGDFGGHSCGFKVFKNGLCKKHQPEAVKARREKLEAKWAAERDARAKRWAAERERNRRADLFPELVAALEEAKLQIQYLHDKFAITGSGAQTLAKIEIALKKAKAHQ